MSDMHRCARCHRLRSEHLLVNFSDGPHVGREVAICPTATYAEEPDVNTFFGETPSRSEATENFRKRSRGQRKRR